MQKVFLSNSTEIPRGIVVTNLRLADLQFFNINQSDDAVFVIDIHCVTNQNRRLQEQGGVIVYRRLLQIFDGKQDRLKVIFYSPISKENLIRLKPENYILCLMPFVEFKCEEGQFENDLNDLIAEYELVGWPQFNNASENLLSGWALYNKTEIQKGQVPIKIDAQNKNILFIDDQQSEWKACFEQIFENCRIFYLLKENNGGEVDSQMQYKQMIAAGWDNYIALLKNQFTLNPDIVLSDLYLDENHEPGRWKEAKDIAGFSGSKVFDALRTEHPATPYLFHTSSNKAAIYKYFDTRGVDEWLVKDVRWDAAGAEKKENYEDFKKAIEHFAKTATYKRVSEIWEEIKSFSEHKIQTPNLKANYINNKNVIDGLLKSSWMAMRRLLNREELFEQSVTGKVESFREDSFTSASICNNLGKILEILKCAKGKKGSFYPDLILVSIQHEASHSGSFQDFNIGDAIIYFKLFFSALTGKFSLRPNYNEKYHQHRVFSPSSKAKDKHDWMSQPLALLWIYSQVYQETEGISSDTMSIIKSRIKQLFEKNSNNPSFIKLINKDFISLKSCQGSVSQVNFQNGQVHFK